MDLETPFAAIRCLASPFLDTRRNDVHTRISTSFALLLLGREPGDRDIVVPAILLHDVGWKRVPEALQIEAFGPTATKPEWNRVHEVEGVRIARDILRSIRYPWKKIEEILHIIDGHDSRKEAVSPNDRIVKDADRLWRYSKEGFRIDLDRFRETPDQALGRLASGLNSWFYTPAGGALATKEWEARASGAG